MITVWASAYNGAYVPVEFESSDEALGAILRGQFSDSGGDIIITTGTLHVSLTPEQPKPAGPVTVPPPAPAATIYDPDCPF